MKKSIVAVLIFLCSSALAQSNSVYNATTYAYTTQVTTGNPSTGSSSIGVNPTGFAQGIPFLPYNLNAPITINRNAATAETLTPSAIANCFPNSLTCALSATFTFKHISGESIQSGTFGLQEAINIAVAAGSGTVLIDASWQGPSGSSLITAAKGNNNVMIQDNRNPSGAAFYQWNGVAYAQAGESGSTGIQSINGDTTQAQQITCSGTGLSCPTAGGVTAFSLSGGGLTGTVNSASNFAMTVYPAAGTGTAVSGAANTSMPPATATLTQLNALMSQAGLSTVLQPGASFGYTNSPQHNRVLYLGMAQPMWAWGVQESGAWCDASIITGQFSSSTNTVTGHTFTSADVGKTIMAVAPNGSGLPTRYIGVIQSLSGSNAVMTANSPFSTGAGWFFTLAHDDNAALLDALSFSKNTGIPLTIPEGICFSSATLPYNGQSISGLGTGASGIVGPAGQDTLAAPDPSTGNQAQAAGGHMHDFSIYFDGEIDAADNPNGNNAAIWSACNTAGSCSNQAGLYRPLGIYGPAANNPLNAQWILGSGAYGSGAQTGVAAVSTSSAVICVPTTETRPTIGAPLLFPYQAAGVDMFQTTVSSYAGSCGAGNPVTMGAPWTAAGAAQAVWFSGSSFQYTSTTIPLSGRTYPFTITLGQSIVPNPEFFVSGFAGFGVFQIGKEQFTYFKTSNGSAAPGASPTVTITSSIQTGTASTGAELHTGGTSAWTFPLNPLSPSTPWAVTPTLNSGPTPAGAAYYPAVGVGNAGLAFPVANGTNYSGTESPAFAHWNDLQIAVWPFGTNNTSQNPIGFQVQNDTAGLYIVPLPFKSTFENIHIVNPYYGIAEGLPSTNTHGYFTNGFPTADSNAWDGITVQSAAYDLWIVGEGSGRWHNTMLFSQAGEPPNGVWPQFTTAYSGALGAWYMDAPQDDSAVVSPGFAPSVQDTKFDTFYVEGETSGSPSLALTQPFFSFYCHICTFLNFTPKSAGLTYFGGDHNSVYGSILGGNGATQPFVNYGSYDKFESVSTLNQTYHGNTWGSSGFLNLGPGTRATAPANGTLGPDAFLAKGNSRAPATGQTSDCFQFGNTASCFTDPASGFITADEFNISSSFDAQPMTVGWTFDDTAPISNSYTACTLPSSGTGCATYQFNQGGGIPIGPGQRLTDTKYLLYTAFKTPGGAQTFQMEVDAIDRGATGFTCTSPGTIGTYTFTTSGTSWQSFGAPPSAPIVVDFTGHPGCTLRLDYIGDGTAGSLQQAYVDFIPVPVTMTAGQFTFPGGQSWTAGAGAPSATCPTTATPVGSIYSNTTGTTNVLYVCQSAGWSSK